MTDKLLYIETFGCQMNVNDTERIVTMMAELGYAPAATADGADMVMLNTCSVRGGAEEKVYKRLSNYRSLKKRNPSLVIGVGGCVAQQEGEALLNRYPWLDLVFGTHNLHLLPDMVRAAERGERRCETAFIDNDQRLDLFPPVKGGAVSPVSSPSCRGATTSVPTASFPMCEAGKSAAAPARSSTRSASWPTAA